MLNPQNGDSFVTTDSATSLHPCIRREKPSWFIHGFDFSVEANELVHVQLTVAVLVESFEQQFHLRVTHKLQTDPRDALPHARRMYTAGWMLSAIYCNVGLHNAL